MSINIPGIAGDRSIDDRSIEVVIIDENPSLVSYKYMWSYMYGP